MTGLLHALTRPAALAAALFAGPLAAQEASLPVATLLAEAAPEAELAGAIGACMLGATNPEAAIAAFTDGGWERSDEFDGTAGFVGKNGMAMFYNPEPGFCMVETGVVGTQDLAGIFLATTDSLGLQVTDAGTDDYGCAMFDLGIGILAVLSGGGQDPVCDSPTDAALRFTVADM